ncbi:hypothetical protein K492DRAFT_174568 [Lichtheimia hyalospora FSU 10163]|nr:hypothetical protein K492DRAFT_174568 [Lichtheimia hyalospora FSU 10163]
MDQYLDTCTNKFTPFSIEVYAAPLTHHYHILYHDAVAPSTFYSKMLVGFISSINHGSLSLWRQYQSTHTHKKVILSPTLSHDTSFVYGINLS